MNCLDVDINRGDIDIDIGMHVCSVHGHKAFNLTIYVCIHKYKYIYIFGSIYLHVFICLPLYKN